MFRFLPLLALCSLCACTSGDIDAPKLGYRDAEAIDPRLPVGQEAPAAGELTLGNQIAAIRARALRGAADFSSLEPQVVSAVAAADAPGSESWTQAQQLLSRLDAARKETALALADLDALVADRMIGEGWVSPANRDAVLAAASEIGRIDARQSALIDRLTGRLAN